MSDPNTLGSLVRRRRLESGFSLGQLASKVGKTAAEVRAWERDNELPEHGILERLAETLELDLDEIKAQLEAEKQAAAAAEESETTEDKEPAESADTDVQAPVALPAELPEEDPGAESAADEAEPEAAALAESEPEEDDDEPGFAVEDPFRPPAAQEDDEFDLLNAPTEAVPVPVITDTAKAARAERAAAVITEAPPLPVVEAAPDSDPGLLRYLEPLRLLFDPNSRYLYWMRAGLTIVVLLILAVVFFDQLGKLLDAVGELLDTIEPSATTPDDLDALGALTG